MQKKKSPMSNYHHHFFFPILSAPHMAIHDPAIITYDLCCSQRQKRQVKRQQRTDTPLAPKNLVVNLGKASSTEKVPLKWQMNEEDVLSTKYKLPSYTQRKIIEPHPSTKALTTRICTRT